MYRRGIRTHPEGELVLRMMGEDEMPWILTVCGWCVKKSRTQLQKEGVHPCSSSLLARVCGMIVLNAELKSRKSHLM